MLPGTEEADCEPRAYFAIAIAPASAALMALSLADAAAAWRFVATAVSSGVPSSLFSLLSISNSDFVASARLSAVA